MSSIGFDVLKLCRFHFFPLVLMIVSPLQIVKLIVPLADHFPGRVTYRGKKHLEEIKKKIIKFGLLDRVKESPFKQFFLAPEFQFSGVLVHQLLLRTIST